MFEDTMRPDRLKLARKKAGLSLRALAKALNDEVTAQAISKYERGLMKPTPRVLNLLAETLQISEAELFEDERFDLEFVRILEPKQIGAKIQDRIAAKAIEHVRRYVEIETILELESAYWIRPRLENSKAVTTDRAELLAKELRELWNLGIGPISNVTNVLETHGIKVLFEPLPKRTFGISMLLKNKASDKEIAVVIIDSELPLEGRRVALARELGRLLIDQASSMDLKKASTAFARSLLMPREALYREVGKERKFLSPEELILLKRVYGVPAYSLLIWLRQIDTISDSTLSYAIQTYAKGWRDDDPDPIEQEDQQGELERPNRFQRLCRWALAEDYISMDKACNLSNDTEPGLQGVEG